MKRSILCAIACVACGSSLDAEGEGEGGDTGSSGGSSTSRGIDGGGSDESGAASQCAVGAGPGLAYVPADPGTIDAMFDPDVPLPDDLSAVGIYPHAPDLSAVADVAMHYEPAWPLWSNGSAKHRYLALPPGAAIDTSDPDAWRFPAGTVMVKTFLFDDGADDCPRPVETRVMRKKAGEGWDYAAYGWDDAGATATRLDITEPVPIPVTGVDGPFVHHVPARIECRGCHESAWGDALGIERLQLSGDGQLDELFARGWSSDPVEPVTIEHADENTRAVLGMFHGNCVHCHNGSGGASSSFDLRHDVALDNTIDRPTESSASASGIRIVPGAPHESILFAAVSGETDDPEVKAMPPMGVDIRDTAAIETLRAFIVALEER